MQFKTKIRIAKVVYHSETVFFILIIAACVVAASWALISMIPDYARIPFLLIVGGVAVLSAIGAGLSKLSRWAHDLIEKVKEYDV